MPSLSTTATRLLTLGLTATLGLLAYLFAGESDAPWYSVVPPLLAIALAIISHRLIPSLLLALLAAGLLLHLPETTGGNLLPGLGYPLQAVGNVLFDWWSLKVMLFVMLILVLISIIMVSGGLRGMAQGLERFANGRRSTQWVTLIMGLLIFIDDYANTMIVGSSMRPLSDRQRISREKLAFLVDATAAPVAGLAVISTWIAFEVGLFQQMSDQLQLEVGGYNMFFDGLAFRFYCIFLLIFLVVMVVSQRDFGPMLAAERRSLYSGRLSAPQAQIARDLDYQEQQIYTHALARVAILPLALMLLLFVAGLWISGGGLTLLEQDGSALWQARNWRLVLGDSNNSLVLLLSTACATALAVWLAVHKAGVPSFYLWEAAKKGVKASLLPIGILLSAWSLKQGFDALQLGKFLISSFGAGISPKWFPALAFLLAALVSFGIGTSWGTMSLLIPIAIPLAYAADGNSYGLVTMITLGAILDGAIFGDHCSPVSDTTIMSSIASNCDHIDHVRTQIPYSLSVALIALLAGYLPAALGAPLLLNLALALLLAVALFGGLGRRVG